MNASQFGSKAVAFAMAFAVLGCQPFEELHTHLASSWGPIMPIQVGANASTWVVQDWLGPGETAERLVYCSSPSSCDTLVVEQGTVTLPGAPTSGLGVLKVLVNDEERMVPVLSKGEQTHTFMWGAANQPQPTSSVGIVGDLTGWTPTPATPVTDQPVSYTHLTLPTIA